MSEDEQRIAERSIPTMHQNSHYDITGDDTYYPVNHRQLRELLGDYLTILDGMNLPDRVHYAIKATMTQTAWRWWDGVYENATTSYKGCIAPIVCDNHKDSKFYPSNRWGYDSEEAYEDATPKTSPFAGTATGLPLDEELSNEQ